MPKFILEKNRELVAIVFIPSGCLDQQGKMIYDCKKYEHNIFERYIPKFCNDMKAKFPAAEYINFYWRDRPNFKERVYLE